MEGEMNRRKILGLFGGFIAVASAPIITYSVNYATPTKVNVSFSDMVAVTLRENAPKIYDNLCAKNPLLAKLKSKEYAGCTQVS